MAIKNYRQLRITGNQHHDIIHNEDGIKEKVENNLH